MGIANIAKKLFALIKAFMLQLWQKIYPPLSPTVNPETQENLQWHNIIMAFCFTSALGIAVLSAQTQAQLPLSFHVLSFAILLTFASLFVAKFIGPNYSSFSQVLEKVPIFLAITAFFFTIAIPLPLSLKCATWAVYASSWLTIALCHIVAYRRSLQLPLTTRDIVQC